MLKVEINKNILTQKIEIYLFDKENYLMYMPNGEISVHKRQPYIVDGVKPYLCIPYDIWEPLKEAFKVELDVEKIEGAASHIKDLRWVLSHFMNKDK